MSQGEKARDTKEKKKVKGWSTGEMKDKPCSSWEEDTGEIIEWRSMSQEEMDQCWKRWTEKIEEEVSDKYKVETAKEVLTEAGAPSWNGGVCEEARNFAYEGGEKIVGQ